eukprot:2609986-Amphidinium_carterae.2
MRALAGKKDHASSSVLNTACGGLWMNDRRSRVFDQNPLCTLQLCQEAEGTASHTLHDCPAFAPQRKEANMLPPRDDIPPCVQVFGLGVHFPTTLPTIEEPPSGSSQMAAGSDLLSPRTGAVVVA